MMSSHKSGVFLRTSINITDGSISSSWLFVMRSKTRNAERLPFEDKHFPWRDSICLRKKIYKEGNQNIYQTVEHVLVTEKEPRLSEALSKVHSSSTQGDPQGCRRQFDKTICECVLNVLEKTVPTSRAVKKRLSPIKKPCQL